MIATAGPGNQYRTTYPPNSGRHARSPLPLLLVLSVVVHAAAFGLWPQPDRRPSEPLPAGPIAVQLHNSGAGGTRAANAAPAENAAIERARSRQPRTAAQAPRPAPRSMPKQSASMPSHIEPPAVRATPSETNDHQSAHGTRTRNPADTGANTGADTGADAGEALRAQLRGRLQNALVAHFNYPLIARRRGWEGVVRVGLRVEPDGQLSGLRVIDSSGHALLDRAALDSLQQVGRLPDVMDWMQGRRLDMVLPVRYRLIDS